MIALRRLCLALVLALPQAVAAQTAGPGAGLSATVRPMARPGAALGDVETVAPAVLAAPSRPRARVLLAPGRPELRPDDVVPQPVSLFLRAGGVPLTPLAGQVPFRTVPPVPLLAQAVAPPPTAFLPATPLRRRLIPVPIPVWERRTERDLAVSPETAALAALIRASVERTRAVRLTESLRAPMRPVSRTGTPEPDLADLADLENAAPDGATPPTPTGPAPLRPSARPVTDARVDAAIQPTLAAEVVIEEDDGFTADMVDSLLTGDPLVVLSDDVTDLAVATAFRPIDRPASFAGLAAEAEREAATVRASLVRGSVCGTIDIQGVTRGTVPGPGACGVENAVEVRSVAGVRLSTPAVIDCGTATALRDWTVNAAIPRFADTGGGLAGIRIMGAYSCRSRNNVAGARLSEHSFGRALDIGGFTFRNGNTVSVRNGWNGVRGDTLRALHRAACRIFGTVLGPDANAAHRDHFHFDTARYRSGSYCR